MSQSIEDRLVKLMAMADHTATNPNEAANAAALAASIAAQHGIDLEELRKKNGTGESGMTHKLAEWHFSKEYADGVWVASLWVGRLFGATPLFFDVVHTPGVKVAYFGKKHAVELSHSWLDYIWRNCLTANTAHAREQNYGSSSARQSARENFRKMYCLAVSHGLRRRLEAMRANTVTHSDGRSLTITNHLDNEVAEANAFLNSLNLNPASKPMGDLDTDSIAARDAWEAGKKLGLEDQIR